MDTSLKVTTGDIIASQVRGARGMLGLSMDELASRSGVAKRTLIRLENGQAEAQPRTLAAIRTALETAGVEFIEQNGGGPGVRLRELIP